MSLPLHAAAVAAATLLLGAVVVVVVAVVAPAAAPPLPGELECPVVVVTAADAVVVSVDAAAATAAAMWGLLLSSQVASCLWRSNSMLVPCIRDSLKVSFIITINQSRKFAGDCNWQLNSRARPSVSRRQFSTPE